MRWEECFIPATEQVLALALEVTPWVVLRHDYLPSDLSVTLYREPLIDTRCDLLLDEAR